MPKIVEEPFKKIQIRPHITSLLDDVLDELCEKQSEPKGQIIESLLKSTPTIKELFNQKIEEYKL